MRSRMSSGALTVVLVALTTACGAQGAADQPGEEERVAQAVQAAEEWLALVDSGDYGVSWDEASTLFKQAIGRDQWIASLGAVRQPLGALRSRAVRSSQYATELPGAPDGEYVVIQFSTAFENKRSAVETVTPMREEDGVWRVSGYYIK